MPVEYSAKIDGIPIMSSRRCRLLVIFLAALCRHSMIAADDRDDARALVHYAQHRDDVVLNGIRWRWSIKKGKCRSIGDALKGAFDENHPVDSYACRWLSNDGVYLYESIAQQERRKLGDDTGQQVLLTTDGSEVFLSTKNSRLRFDPKPFVSWHGDVQNRMHGLSEIWGPGGVPVHGGCFGMARIAVLLDRISNLDNVVTLRGGVTVTGVDSKVLRITGKDGSEEVYHFGVTGLSVLQRDHFYAGALRAQVVVLETQTLSGSSGELELPAVAVSFYRPEGQKLWSVTQMTSIEAKLEPVPLSEMVVPTENAVLALYPTFNRQTADFVTEISAENLDEVVETLYKNLERDKAHLSELNARRRGRLGPETSGPVLTYILIFNAIALIACVLYLYYRKAKRKTQNI